MAEESIQGGQILEDAPLAPLAILGRGAVELHEGREALFRSVTREYGALRRPLREANANLLQTLDRLKPSTSGPVLTGGALTTFESAAIREVQKATAQVKLVLEEGIRKAVFRASRSHEKFLDKAGFPRLSAQQMSKLRQETLNKLYEEFPVGSGQTLNTRLANFEQKHITQIKGFVSEVSPGGMGAVKAKLRKSLTHTAPGRVFLPGGSASKDAQRLLVAEEARMANAVEVGLMRAHGMGFSYWRLDPSHKWYGGGEICEILAYEVDFQIINQLELAGIEGSMGVKLEGLHSLDAWPSFPHPHCRCHPEPLILPESFRSIKEGLALTVGGAGLIKAVEE